MGKRFTIFLMSIMILVCFLSFASAIKTNIKVKTIPYYNVEVAVADGTISDFSLIQRLKGTANYYGDINFTLDSALSRLDLYFFVKSNGETVAEQKMLDVKNTGESIELELAPEGYELTPTPEINETNVKNNAVLNETSENVTQESGNITAGAGITGASIVDTIFSKKMTYIIVGVIIGLAVLFMVLRVVKRGNHYSEENNGPQITIRKLSEIRQAQQNPAEDNSRAIADAEMRIKQAQEEINRIKNQERIKELRKRISSEQNELNRLGEDSNPPNF